jgi:hypothetical protein
MRQLGCYFRSPLPVFVKTRATGVVPDAVLFKLRHVHTGEKKSCSSYVTFTRGRRRTGRRCVPYAKRAAVELLDEQEI